MKKLVFASLCCATLVAHAQTSEFAQLIPADYMKTDLKVAVGLDIVSLPKYTGDDERYITPYPIIDAQWKNGAFFSSYSGLGYNFSKNPQFEYGPRLTMESARDAGQTSKLNGIGDVTTAIEAGGFFNYLPTPGVALLSSIRYGSGVDHMALQASLGARLILPVSGGHLFVNTLSVNWVDANYTMSYFGVTPTQSAASGYAVYTPGAGLQNVKFNSTWEWHMSPEWSVNAGVTVKHLLGDSANSPFVFQKTPVSVYGGAAYHF
jgi:outer membrane protein